MAAHRSLTMAGVLKDLPNVIEAHETKAVTKGRQEVSSLTRRMSALAVQTGVNASTLPGISFQRITQAHARSPAVYEPSVKIVGQGRIRGHLGREVFSYDAENYLVLAVPLPVECEIEASLAKPLVFMSVDLDWTVLGLLSLEMGHGATRVTQVPRAIRASPLTAELRDTTLRLLKCLRLPAEARVLGPAIVREIYYRVLLGEQGEMLRAAAVHHGGFGQVSQALRIMHRDYGKSTGIESLARAVGMSVPTFYRHFKAVTATTPLRYLQALRLHKARSLIAHEGLGVATAAAQVGYESASQFSREFRRLFGRSPRADAKKAGAR